MFAADRLMKPLFFGSAERKLFGIYQLPSGGSRVNSSHAILLCYPGIHEYNTSHWAFRRLASMLTKHGFHVLRFDYFGTGDSMGEVADGNPTIWEQNIQEAARELLDISGARLLSLVGMRLGAALAYRACGSGLTAKHLILWEPVVSGKAYVQELERFDRSKNLLFLHSSRTRTGHQELLGYRFPTEARRAIEALDLLSSPTPSVESVRFVVSGERELDLQLQSSLQRAGLTTTRRIVKGAAGAEATQSEKAVLSNDILIAINDELAAPQAAQPKRPG